MRRVLILGLLWTLAGLGSAASLRAQDVVRYLERTVSREATGSIVEESPALVVLRTTGAGGKEIPARDIVDITYEVPTLVRPAYRSALGDERRTTDPSLKEEDRKKAYGDALKGYQEVLPRVTGERRKFIERHIQFRIACLRVQQAI